MTINRGLWVPINTGNVGTTEVEARLADAALFESNNGTDARSGLLTPATTTVVTGTANMGFNVASVEPVITRVAGEGVYRFSTTGVTNVPNVAAPTANSRIDVVYIKQNDQSKGDANNLAVAGVVNGVVAASPVAPAIPTGAHELARATITANMVATNTAAITQTWRYAALAGEPIPVRNTTERAEITAPRLGQRLRRLDYGTEFVEVWDGAKWIPSGGEVPYAHLGKTDGFTTGTANPQTMAAQVLKGGMTYAANGITLPYTGRYRINGKVYASGGSGGAITGVVMANGANTGIGASWNKVQVDEYQCFGGTKPFNAGDVITLQTVSAPSVYGGDGWNGTYLDIEWQGA